MRAMLTRLNSLSIKIPMMLVVGTLLAALAVGLNSHFLASKALIQQDTDGVKDVATYRAGVVSRFGESFRSDLMFMTQNPSLREAYEFLGGVYDLNPEKIKQLHRHYAERAVPSGGSRAEYNGADDPSAYAVAHRRVHPMLRAFARDKKYYDMFFITNAGDVFYTVEKESDFATNLRTGPWRSTGLARAFEGALAKGAKGGPHFEDFESYGPSNGDAAAFLAQALVGESGGIMGVVAIQLPDSVFAKELAAPFLGTGAAYVVGSDGRLRMPVSSRGDHKVFAKTPYQEIVKSLATTNAQVGQFATSLNGEPAYVAITRTSFIDKDWYVVAELKTSDIYQHVQDLAQKNLLIGVGIVAVISLLAFFAATRITKPIRSMSQAVGMLAAGQNCMIPGEDRKDELGELARSLRKVHEASIAASQIKSALDSASVNVMVASVEGKIVYCNPAMIKFFREHAQDFRQQFPSFSAEEMIGATIDQFHRSSGWKNEAVDNARVRIGSLTLDLKVNRIQDADGQSLGMITEWTDLTSDLAAIGEVTAVVDAAVRGDFSGRIREDNKSGAMRDLAAGQNRINTIVEAAMEDFSETLRKVAGGDLIVRVDAAHQGRFAQLGNGINDTISRLAETVSTIQRSAQDLSRAAGEINAGATDLAKRTEEEASSLEETAATTEELAASVKQTAENSKIANQLSERAKVLASDGGVIVHQAIHAIERIEEASKKITDIISVIDDIAFQTNLLALNAAVEAARAGDAGKGFAVVASEVRTLAQRSGQAARDIKDLIVGSASQVVEGVKLVHATGGSLDKIVGASEEVAQMIAMIHEAATEQAHGIEEMSTAVARIDEMTQQNSALAEESAASASELMKQLERLNALVGAFRIDGGHSHRPVLTPAPSARPSPSGGEPERLQQLAARAFAQSRLPSPEQDGRVAQSAPQRQAASAPPRMAASGGGMRVSQEWTEF